MTINQKQAVLNSGGGIVADSVPSKEYSELLSKVSNLFQKKYKTKINYSKNK